jgi:uncharacterized protein YkwD
MKTRFLTKLLTAVLLFSYLHLISQNPNMTELRGRVVELVNGKAVGVSKITVYVDKASYDITGNDGSFKVQVPSGKNFIKITLENTNRQVIVPYEGVVNLPPSGNVDIQVCSQQNRELKAKVEQLNGNIKTLQSKYNLSQKRVEELQKEMVVKVLDFEKQIQIIQEDNVRSKTANDAALKEKDDKIAQLESELQNTLQQLLKAKDEQFLRKQAQLEKIAGELKKYQIAGENLNDMILPDKIPHYFSYNGQAVEQLNGKVADYNTARELIMKNQDVNLSGVQHYWQDPSVTKALEGTYAYLLNELHEKNFYQANVEVIDPIGKFKAGKMGRLEGQRKASIASKESYSKIKVMLPVLEEKINSSLNILKQNF